MANISIISCTSHHPYCSRYICYGTDKESLFNNQDLQLEELNASLRSCERVKIDWKETKGGCSSELYFNL